MTQRETSQEWPHETRVFRGRRCRWGPPSRARRSTRPPVQNAAPKFWSSNPRCWTCHRDSLDPKTAPATGMCVLKAARPLPVCQRSMGRRAAASLRPRAPIDPAAIMLGRRHLGQHTNIAEIHARRGVFNAAATSGTKTRRPSSSKTIIYEPPSVGSPASSSRREAGTSRACREDPIEITRRHAVELLLIHEFDENDCPFDPATGQAHRNSGVTTASRSPRPRPPRGSGSRTASTTSSAAWWRRWRRRAGDSRRGLQPPAKGTTSALTPSAGSTTTVLPAHDRGRTSTTPGAATR